MGTTTRCFRGRGETTSAVRRAEGFLRRPEATTLLKRFGGDVFSSNYAVELYLRSPVCVKLVGIPTCRVCFYVKLFSYCWLCMTHQHVFSAPRMVRQSLEWLRLAWLQPGWEEGAAPPSANSLKHGLAWSGLACGKGKFKSQRTTITTICATDRQRLILRIPISLPLLVAMISMSDADAKHSDDISICEYCDDDDYDLRVIIMTMTIMTVRLAAVANTLIVRNSQFAVIPL